jgi:nucleoside-diphosphate-sugar epimerase
MRVLVTGHQGYIGSDMVPVFLETGHEVVGLDNGLYEACRFGDRRHEVASFRLLGGRYMRLAEIKPLQGPARLNDQLRWTGVNGG